jgi:hypothetical protein
LLNYYSQLFGAEENVPAIKMCLNLQEFKWCYDDHKKSQPQASNYSAFYTKCCNCVLEFMSVPTSGSFCPSEQVEPGPDKI